MFKQISLGLLCSVLPLTAADLKNVKWEESEFAFDDEQSLFQTDTPSAPSTTMSAPPKPYDTSSWDMHTASKRLHYTFYGDFLYWQAINNDTTWGLEQMTPVATQKIRFDFGWDVGFRIGGQFKPTWENLVMDLNWTRFHTTSTNEYQEANLFNVPNGSYPKFTLMNLPFADYSFGNPWAIQANYTLDFDQIDFTGGKSFFPTKAFSLTPFLGARGIILTHRLETMRYSAEYGFSPTTPEGPWNTSVIKYTNVSYAVGLLLGLNSGLQFGKGFGLRAGGDVFVGYGPDKATNSASEEFAGEILGGTSIYLRKHHCLKTMLDLGVGLDWKKGLIKDRMEFLLAAGYEFHMLFDSPIFVFNDSQDPTSMQPPYVTMGFQGLTIRAGLSF